MRNGKYFDALERMSRQERSDYSRLNLAQALKRSYEQSTTGRELFNIAGLVPADIKSPTDLTRLSITRKNDIIDLEKKRPFAGFLTIPVEEVNRIFITPGPIYEPLHAEGISWFGRALWAAGFRKGDVVADTFSYHLSPGGLLFHEAIRECGATAVPVGTGNTEILVRTMFDIKVNGFVGTPSYLLSVIKKAEEMGYDWNRDSELRKAWFTGEMLTNSIRQMLEQNFGINTSQAYAVSEVGGALAYECSEKNGLHLMDEYVIEIVDPETGEVLEPGKTGEVVVTPVANPTWGLFRFGTGDLSAVKPEGCGCGRTSLMLTGIAGRVGDAVKVRGVFLVGKQVESLLAGVAGVGKIQAIVDRQQQRDEILVKIELKDSTANRQVLSGEVARRFQAQCLVRPDRIEFVESGVIPEGAKAVSDIRKWQ